MSDQYGGPFRTTIQVAEELGTSVESVLKIKHDKSIFVGMGGNPPRFLWHQKAFEIVRNTRKEIDDRIHKRNERWAKRRIESRIRLESKLKNYRICLMEVLEQRASRKEDLFPVKMSVYPPGRCTVCAECGCESCGVGSRESPMDVIPFNPGSSALGNPKRHRNRTRKEPHKSIYNGPTGYAYGNWDNTSTDKSYRETLRVLDGKM